MAEQKNGAIVLVHGAWCQGSVWQEVLIQLAHEGHRVRAAQLPLQSFAGDVAAVHRLLDQVEGPVLLVGHSYAGAVITEAGRHSKVGALAYVCAFAPDAEEAFGGALSVHPGQEQMTIAPDAEGYLWLDAAFAGKALGHDLHRGVIHLMVATQTPTHGGLFASTLSEPAWKTKPCAYLLTTEDRILAPETQRELATKIHAQVEELSASHLVPLAQPAAVAGFLSKTASTLLPA